MIVSVHPMCFSKAMIAPFVGVILVFIANVNASLECSLYEFPCEDGGCVDYDLWCDSTADCDDGSDEKYCKKSIFYLNPNNCPLNYFRCDNGPCIPMVGVCDEYPQCEDNSDERNCQHLYSLDSTTTQASSSFETNISTNTIATATDASKMSTNAVTATTLHIPVNNSIATHLPDSQETDQHSILVANSNFLSSDYHEQLQKARDWLLSQRKSDFGWGAETHRAITALFLSDVQQSSRITESDMLMMKQLEVCLSLDIARNGSKPMKLTDLALYINALVAICKDPKNFYGENLVRILRNGVNAAHRKGQFVNPSVYLTLCLNNVTTYDDVGKFHHIIYSRFRTLERIDVQALTLLTSACLFQNTNYLPAPVYDSHRRRFLRQLKDSTHPGNVYEAALLMQALHALKVIQPELMSAILQKQQDDISFGSILATYMVLPVLAGKNFLQINEHCSNQYTTDPAPIEVLKNMKRRKITVKYSLRIGYPIETTETVEMQVADGVSFLNIMRLAQEINQKFRFMLDGNREIPVVYSIGGIPNDAEKGLFWNLYLLSMRNRVSSEGERLVPFSGNIKTLIPDPGDEFIFWIRSI